jgi:hypothetical protein
MSGSGCGCPGIFSDLHFDVQIDTKLFRAESTVIHGLQRSAFSFNRTVVIALINPKKLSWTGKNPLMVRQAHHERVFKLSPEG